jgi:ubiquitin-conjugating enzyme E2 G1
MQFLDPIPFHPNVYEDGRVCISILHPPGEDQYGYESASERWSPAQTPESILISVVRHLFLSIRSSSVDMSKGRLGLKDYRRVVELT